MDDLDNGMVFSSIANIFWSYVGDHCLNTANVWIIEKRDVTADALEYCLSDK
jgi:hypothetical protein